MKVINVPKHIKFMSDVEEIKTIYGNDLPHNAIIDKQLTGVGGTTIALRNQENYVIAVQTIKLVKNKAQTDGAFPFYGETSDEELIEYLLEGNKIITTYDSVPRVARLLGSKVSDFRLLVDEYHRMLAYTDNFKVRVCLNLLENTYKFKSVSYMTATPTDLDWLPKPMKSLEYIKFDWEGKTYPDLKHSYAKSNINERVLTIILDKLENTDEELYIFYNSRKGVATILKKLFKCKKLSMADVNLLFADTTANTKYFKQHLKKFTYGEIPDGVNNKRLNFISSMCYEGTDFFPNMDPKKTPTTIVVSNPNSITMRFDIQIDLVQIAGRFRRHKELNIFMHNPIIYVWNTQKVDYIKDKDEYLRELQLTKKESIEALELASSNGVIKQLVDDKAETNTHKFFIPVGTPDKKETIIHPYAIEVNMSNYEAFHSVSCVMGNTDKDGELKENSKVVTKLTELSPDLSTYEIPELNSKYTKLLGRRASVDKMLREYRALIEERSRVYQMDDSALTELTEFKIEEFLQDNSEFDEWLDSGVTLANINSAGKDRNKINQLAETNRKLSAHFQAIMYELGLQVGEVYDRAVIKEKIQAYYDKVGIPRKAKGTDIAQWFEVKETTRREGGKLIKCQRVLSIKDSQ